MKMKCPLCGVSGSVSDSLLGKKVRCPKCKEIFRVTAAEASPVPKKEPRKEPVIETSEYVTEAEPAPGMTAQDEAALEQEIAKIFDDMKNSVTDPGPESETDTGPSEYVGSMINQDMATKDIRKDAGDTETPSLSEDDLESELEEMLGKKCSVCGTFVNQATKHEIGGNLYCSVCLPGGGGVESDSSAGKDLAVSEGPGLKSAWKGYWKTKGITFAGITAIVVILVALFYQLFLKRN